MFSYRKPERVGFPVLQLFYNIEGNCDSFPSYILETLNNYLNQNPGKGLGDGSVSNAFVL